MRRRVAVLAIFAVVFASGLFAQQPVGTSGTPSTTGHVMLTPSEATWGPAPDALPPGAQLAVLAGDPMASTGTFTVRLKVPDGYLIPPHWHPTDEDVTVVEGTLKMGMGDKISESAMKNLVAGSFAKMPKGERHYAQASGASVIQISGPAPFAITYVNAGDDPRNKKQ